MDDFGHRKGGSWLRYCARLQLALLQNVEDNLVREQAELDLAATSAGLLLCFLGAYFD